MEFPRRRDSALLCSITPSGEACVMITIESMLFALSDLMVRSNCSRACWLLLYSGSMTLLSNLKLILNSESLLLPCDNISPPLATEREVVSTNVANSINLCIALKDISIIKFGSSRLFAILHKFMFFFFFSTRFFGFFFQIILT